jgi:hypothetical protein
MDGIHLHIGPAKTGTSAIQAALADNSAALRRIGFLYPSSGMASIRNPTFNAHHNLAWELQESARFDSSRGTWDDVLAELRSSDARTAILSSEGFFAAVVHRPRRFDARLRQLAQTAPVIVHFVDRADAERTESQYCERIRLGLRPSLEQHLSKWIAIKPHFDAALQRISRINRVTLQRHAYSNDESFVPQFLKALGAEIQYSPQKPNVREDAKVLSYLLRRFPAGMPMEDSIRVTQCVRAAIAALGIGETGPFTLLSPAQQALFGATSTTRGAFYIPDLAAYIPEAEAAMVDECLRVQLTRES